MIALPVYFDLMHWHIVVKLADHSFFSLGINMEESCCT